MRVCLAGEFHRPPEYATLSHCWGKFEILELRKDNLIAFQAQVSEAALSKSFRDAIRTSRVMGFSYIWIDSLCIIQDDVDDWRRESALMTHVYGASSLNIAASGAVDGNRGCFFERPRSLRCQIQAVYQDRLLTYTFVPREMYMRSLAEMPLVQRGWALQERLLPSRTLHFTSTQLFWECHHKVACEIFPESIPPSLAYRLFLKKQPIRRSMWKWIVETYSRCQLSHSQDKLVAIAGLAHNIQEQTGDQYVAGMWRENLESWLCWSAVWRDTKRIDPYVAPSWSWASLDGPVSYTPKKAKLSHELWIKVENVHIDFSGPDPLGQISSANLLVNCSCIFPVTFLHARPLSIGSGIVMWGIPIEGFVGCDLEEYLDLKNVHMMPILGSSRSGRIEGLVLVLTGSKKGQYRRIGNVVIAGYKNLRDFEAAIDVNLMRTTIAEYSLVEEDKGGKIRRFIELV